MQIRPFSADDLEIVLDFAIRAWAPVFDSLQEVLSPTIFRALYPDWRVSQRAAVEAVCTGGDHRVWVAEVENAPVGFVAVILHEDDSIGEIYMIAVDPAHQRKGIAAALTEHAVAWIKEAGMEVAMVSTGGDEGHAPARQTYERAGFRLLPLAQYYKKL